LEEGVGWLGEGCSAAYCSQVRGEIVQNIRTGNGYQSLKEKRDQEEARLKKEAEKKATLARQNTTFKALAKKYLEWSKSNKKSWTVDDGAFRKHILPEIGNIPAKDISVLTMERLKKTLKKNGLSEASVRYYLSLVGSVFYKAEAWGIFNGENPLKAASNSNKKFMKISDNRRLRFLSHEEANQLLHELKSASPQLHDICLLSLHAGLRVGECFDLTWRDVDMQHGVINIRNPKNDETRQAYLTPQLKKMFESKTPDNQKKNELIYKNRKGQRIREISYAFTKAVDRLGFNEGVGDAQNKVVPHSLRHTFASWLCLQGTPLFTVKELMGHKRIEMTERYSHLLPSHKQEAVLQLAENQSKAVIELEKKRKEK